VSPTSVPGDVDDEHPAAIAITARALAAGKRGPEGTFLARQARLGSF
jgi:hypothetical protein